MAIITNFLFWTNTWHRLCCAVKVVLDFVQFGLVYSRTCPVFKYFQGLEFWRTNFQGLSRMRGNPVARMCPTVYNLWSSRWFTDMDSRL